MKKGHETVRISDVAITFAGGTPDRSEKRFFGGDIPWVKSGEVAGASITTTEETLTPEGLANSAAKWCEPGATLVAMYGATAGQVGRLAIRATTNQAVLCVQARNAEDADFLYYAIQASIRRLIRKAQGSGQPNLNAGMIRDLEIPWPDISIRRSVSGAFGLLDRMLLGIDKLIAAKREFKRGLMQELLTGRRRFPEYADRDVEVVPLGQLCDIRIGGTPKRSMPQYWAKDGEEGFPWATIADLKSRWVCKTAERITQVGVNNSSAKLIPRGTTLMSFKLTIGRVARAGCDLYCNEAIAAFYPKTDVVLSAYLYEILPFAVRYANPDIAVKGATLNKAKLEELPIRLPQPDEQRRISKIGELLDLEIERLEQLHSLLTKQQRGLMQKLLTGELAVPVSSEPEPVHA